MKTMRKIFTLVLTMTILLSMVVTANAADSDLSPTAMMDAAYITINGAAAGTTYQLYRILDIEMISSEKEAVYILKAGGDWDEFFKGEYKEENGAQVLVNAYASQYFTISGQYVKATTLTDQQAQQLADLALAYATEKGISPDITANRTISGNHTSSEARPFGLYVMVSYRKNEQGNTVLTPKANVFTLPDLSDNTYDITIYEKNESVHSITKEVQEDSLAASAVDNYGWGETNAAEIEQPIQFRIRVDLAPGTDDYIITDSMPNFENIKDLEVLYNGSKGSLIEGEEYTVEITNNTENQNGFIVTLLSNARKYSQDEDYLIITYSAMLKSSATIAGTGNTNTAVLYDGEQSEEDKVGEDTTTTYTYKMTVTKKNEIGEPLANAKFQLTREDGTVIKFTRTTTDEGYIYVIDPNAVHGTADGFDTITTDPTGKFVICGLDSYDVYYLVETEAPDGYVLMDKTTVQIIPTAGSTSYEHSIEVVNLPGVEMPETGGMGTTVFYVAGGILVLAAVALLVTKKRMGA